jgi:hypothetical protein
MKVHKVILGKYDYPEILVYGRSWEFDAQIGDTITIDVRDAKNEIRFVTQNFFDEKFKGVYRVR